MSKRELGRVEVLARVKSEQLRLVDGVRRMELSYRQTKRLWKRYGEEGAAGLKHGTAVQPSVRGEVAARGVGTGAREVQRGGGECCGRGCGVGSGGDGGIGAAGSATNTTLARLGQAETIWAAADALRAWIER